MTAKDLMWKIEVDYGVQLCLTTISSTHRKLEWKHGKTLLSEGMEARLRQVQAWIESGETWYDLPVSNKSTVARRHSFNRQDHQIDTQRFPEHPRLADDFMSQCRSQGHLQGNHGQTLFSRHNQQ